VWQFIIKIILQKDDLWELVENDVVVFVQINPKGGLVVQPNQT
jgi:hypothetical protein